MRLFSLVFIGILAVGFAQADETGRFRLRISDDSLRLAKLTGKASPAGRLALLAGGAFELQADGATRKGKFRKDDGKLFLTADDGTELQGEWKGDKVTVEGLAFEKETPLEMAGTWTTRRNGFEEKGLRMELKKDGKFRFVMAGATSEGRWSAVDGKLVLVWTKIDGEMVEEGTVKKEFPVSDDGVSFKIDTYHYERASGN